MLNIVNLADRPDVAPVVAEWLHGAFDHPHGPTMAKRIENLHAHTAPDAVYVLFDDATPVGSASFVRHDLSSRPDLSPWLAGVVVDPAFRGRGYSPVLVRHIEAIAKPTTPILWLYTWTAAPLYARLGWVHAGVERDTGRDIAVALMKRDLR